MAHVAARVEVRSRPAAYLRLEMHQKSLLGLLFVVAGLALNPWLVGYLAADDGTIDKDHIAAGILLCGALLVLTGLQLLFRWVQKISWTGQVSAVRGAAVVGLCAALIAGTYWRVMTFIGGHDHNMTLVDAGGEITPQQEQWAQEFYQRSLMAAVKNGWFDIEKARAQGFQDDRINRTHFPNLQNMFDDVILDPERPEWLIYSDLPGGGKVLMGFMFFTREPNEVGPTPAGNLAQWHYHHYDPPKCAIKGLWTVSDADEKGECAEGIPVMRSPEMFHVWLIDHPLGRFTEMNVVPEYWQDNQFDVKRIHPVTVHFAIAFFILAALLDVTAKVTRKQELHRFGWITLVCAAVAAVAAVTAGMSAEIALKPTHEAHATLDVHRTLGYASLAAILLLAVWRYTLRGGFPQRTAAGLVYLLLSAASVGAVGAAGYYGGEMVYTHGAGVRAIDQFARNRYWRQVKEIYRAPDPSDAGGAPATRHHGH
jgi:uncharacterized membrane protein